MPYIYSLEGTLAPFRIMLPLTLGTIGPLGCIGLLATIGPLGSIGLLATIGPLCGLDTLAKLGPLGTLPLGKDTPLML